MRLTYKLEEPINTKYLHYDYMVIADYDFRRGNYGRITDDQIYNKLGPLEDIEEEFKINAKIVLLCALHQNIYIKDLDDYRRHYIKYGHVFFKYKNKTYILPYEDYGKTWAVTKEELE